MIHETKKIIKEAGFSFVNSPQELVASLIRESLKFEADKQLKPKNPPKNRKPSESDQSEDLLETDRQEQEEQAV